MSTTGASAPVPVSSPHPAPDRRRLFIRSLLQLSFFVGISMLAAAGVWALREPILNLGNWGYIGGFFIEMANSATVFIPLPGSAVTFSLGAALNPWLLGFLGGLGAALGEMTGYMMGVSGRAAMETGSFYGRFQRMTARWGGPVLFGCAILPVPFDFAGVWAGSARYPLWRFFIFVTPGKIIKITGYALAGGVSIGWLERFLNA